MEWSLLLLRFLQIRVSFLSLLFFVFFFFAFNRVIVVLLISMNCAAGEWNERFGIGIVWLSHAYFTIQFNYMSITCVFCIYKFWVDYTLRGEVISNTILKLWLKWIFQRNLKSKWRWCQFQGTCGQWYSKHIGWNLIISLISRHIVNKIQVITFQR